MGGWLCLFVLCSGVGWNLEEADLELELDLDIKVMEEIARWRGEILIYCILYVVCCMLC